MWLHVYLYECCLALFHHYLFFFFNDTATTEIYTLSLHDALPICVPRYKSFIRESERAGFHAIANAGPSPTPTDAAYSMCKTRLGASDCDFDDACTIRGRIARTPPKGTRQSTAVTRVERSWSASSLRTPSVWVPGSTRRGPFSATESSRCRRRASTLLSALSGACA